MSKDQLSFLDESSWSSLLSNEETSNAQLSETDSDETLSLKDEPRVFNVSELNGLIRGKLEGEFSGLWLKAEISNFKAHTSGHFYFSLKDDKSQISAVMFKGLNSKLKFRPDNGMEVLVFGKITVYEPRGNYQIFCESMEPVGEGVLQKAFEQLKTKLANEGLFDVTKKRKLPEFPKQIAIITSPTGAVIRDILNVLSRRNNLPEITLFPVRVQGELAAKEIVKAVELANKLKVFDVLIIARGGGSLEDLWPFNEEVVARAIATSKIPTISAVGHEVDFTISDFVADVRAPTPSAAAEIVIKSISEITEKILFLKKQIVKKMDSKILSSQQDVKNFFTRLADPKKRLITLVQRCDELSERLINSADKLLKEKKLKLDLQRAKVSDPTVVISWWRNKTDRIFEKICNIQNKLFDSKKNKFLKNISVLNSLSPLKVMERGYSIVKHKDAIVTQASLLEVNQTIEIQFHEGFASAKIESIK